jgi:hypothetical protein
VPAVRDTLDHTDLQIDRPYITARAEGAGELRSQGPAVPRLLGDRSIYRTRRGFERTE